MSALLTKHDVAARLAVSPRTVLRLAETRQLAHIRIRGAMRFDDADVAAFLERQRRPAAVPATVTPVPLPAPRKRRFM